MTAAEGPTISVVMPAYNEELYIGEALDSILAQTRAPLEVIVVDDGSTDETVEIVKGYGDQVRLIQQENRGCHGAFDTGLREATGDFVSLCPADDVYEPQKLEWQGEALAANPAIDVAFGAAQRFGLASGEHLRPSGQKLLDNDSFAREMYRVDVIPDPSAVMRRSLYFELGGYKPIVGEDYEFWMRALSAGATFYFDPRPLVRLREHGGNLSHRALEIWETNHMVHVDYARLAGDPELVRRTIARDLLMIGYCRAALGRKREARRSFRGSLETRFSPLSLAAALTMSVPGVARGISKLAPKIRRASAAISG
jgi:glycosyltransferase involved in cell wall biosynthesis